MKLTIESTEQFGDINGIACRVWKGKSEGGSMCLRFVPAIATVVGATDEAFDRELMELTVAATWNEANGPVH